VRDPDYCDHGKGLRERCYFCKREAAKRRGRPPKAVQVEPLEHRNPRAEERESFGVLSGRAGGLATAAKRARERGEVAWADL